MVTAAALSGLFVAMPAAALPGPAPTELQLKVAAELFSDHPPGFPFDVDIHDVELPGDDDFGVPSDDETVQEDTATASVEAGFESVLVVCNLPVVPAEKYDKLAAVINKIFGTAQRIVEGAAALVQMKASVCAKVDSHRYQHPPTGGFYMPKDESGMTKGFAFIEFETPQQAAAAMAATNGKALDKNHSFLVKPFNDIDRLAKLSEQYEPPKPKEFKPVDSLYSWMTDKLGRDQFVIRADTKTFIMWNDGKRTRVEEVYSRVNWTESIHTWSPLGTYITTLHRAGAQIWGGPNWERINRFMHQGVRALDISPNEQYLLTYSMQEATGPREKTTVSFLVHDIRTAKKLRLFDGPVEDYAVGSSSDSSGALKWPVFKWAGGKPDQFMARLGKNMLSVYQAPDMALLDNKSLKLDGVQDFQWSPAEPLLAAYTSEMNQMPARVVLIRLPDRVEVRQKNLFSVKEIGIQWHPQGDYLAIMVERYTKTKKSSTMGFELFSIRDKDIPMEVLELPTKTDKVLGFAWEPKGHRFCIIHGDGPRPSVSIYSMRDDKGRLAVRHVTTLANRACTQVHWSPQGRNLLLVGLKTFNGQLEFYSVDEQEVLATAEHFMASHIEWDPTGRYVATTAVGLQTDNSFRIWSFQGRLLFEAAKDKLSQFNWRPRLPNLLSPEKEAELLKNLKQYTKKSLSYCHTLEDRLACSDQRFVHVLRRYDEEDEALLLQADADVLQERQKSMDEWKAYMARRSEHIKLLDGFKREMYGPRYDEKPYTLETVTMEQVIETKEEPGGVTCAILIDCTLSSCPMSGDDGALASAAKRFRIYTRTGDSGTSCLYTGERLPKDSAYFEALGDVDELNSALGIAREFTEDKDVTVAFQLKTIQSRLIDVGSAIATPATAVQGAKVGRTRFDSAHTSLVESWIDSLDAGLPPLRHFILPSGGKASAFLHAARSICRRAERSVVALARAGSATSARAAPAAAAIPARSTGPTSSSCASVSTTVEAIGAGGEKDSRAAEEALSAVQQAGGQQQHEEEGGSSASETGAGGVEGPDAMDPAVPVYLNRLSDYLFTAARYMAAKEGHPEVTYQKAA
ncbi:hypothetical protein QJQ45_014394 [Haematococcus lacustris]|nr:hypothetical protein QJQ45_014394 [Haematococcus lacustris]